MEGVWEGVFPSLNLRYGTVWFEENFASKRQDFFLTIFNPLISFFMQTPQLIRVG